MVEVEQEEVLVEVGNVDKLIGGFVIEFFDNIWFQKQSRRRRRRGLLLDVPGNIFTMER